MFPWGGEINYGGTSLILSLLQLFLMCTGNEKDHSLPFSPFAHTSPFLAVSVPLFHVFHVRGSGACIWLPPFSCGSAKEAHFCILCE